MLEDELVVEAATGIHIVVQSLRGSLSGSSHFAVTFTGKPTSQDCENHCGK